VVGVTLSIIFDSGVPDLPSLRQECQFSAEWDLSHLCLFIKVERFHETGGASHGPNNLVPPLNPASFSSTGPSDPRSALSLTHPILGKGAIS
jgi:hypothetical protein